MAIIGKLAVPSNANIDRYTLQFDSSCRWCAANVEKQVKDITGGKEITFNATRNTIRHKYSLEPVMGFAGTATLSFMDNGSRIVNTGTSGAYNVAINYDLSNGPYIHNVNDPYIDGQQAVYTDAPYICVPAYVSLLTGTNDCDRIPICGWSNISQQNPCYIFLEKIWIPPYSSNNGYSLPPSADLVSSPRIKAQTIDYGEWEDHEAPNCIFTRIDASPIELSSSWAVPGLPSSCLNVDVSCGSWAYSYPKYIRGLPSIPPGSTVDYYGDRLILLYRRLVVNPDQAYLISGNISVPAEQLGSGAITSLNLMTEAEGQVRISVSEGQRFYIRYVLYN